MFGKKKKQYCNTKAVTKTNFNLIEVELEAEISHKRAFALFSL